MNLRELVALLRETRWSWVALSVALAPIGLWTRAWRWHYLFPPGSDPPGLVSATMIGYMANNVLPLRAGELVRVYVVARRWGHGFWMVVATLIVERLLDSLAIVAILGVLVLLIPVPRAFEWAAAALVIADLAAMGVLLALAVAPGPSRRIVQRLGRRWPRLERRALGMFETFVRGLDGIRAPAHLLPLTAWTIIVWSVAALAAWAMLRAVNLDLPWVAGWTVLAFVGLSIAIPSAPGYVGVFHAAATLAVGIFGVPPAAGLGYALLFHASQFVPVTLAGWLCLLHEHMRLSEARVAPPSSDLPPA